MTCAYCIAGCLGNTKQPGEVGAAAHASVDWVKSEIAEYDGVIALTGGEPLLHPHIEEIAKAARNKTVVIYTNGTLARKYKTLLQASNIYWVLSSHTRYRTPEQFALIRDMFPIQRTLINYLAFDDIQREACPHYVGDHTYFVSRDARTPQKTGVTESQIQSLIEGSKFALPDGFIYDGVCEKAYNKYVGGNDGDPGVEKKKADPMHKVPKISVFSPIIKNCGLSCNAIATNIHILNFLSNI